MADNDLEDKGQSPLIILQVVLEDQGIREGRGGGRRGEKGRRDALVISFMKIISEHRFNAIRDAFTSTPDYKLFSSIAQLTLIDFDSIF